MEKTNEVFIPTKWRARISKDNIIGLWMIKYMVCFGIQFYNRMILNEVSIKFTHSKAIESHAAFHLAFYWK